MRTNEDIEQALGACGPAVWRACAVYFRGQADAEDAYQETFLRYALADDTRFTSTEHKQAWLIRVATNVCKDMLRRAERRNQPLDESEADQAPAPQDPLAQPGSFTSEVLDALHSLDDPPRTPVYLAVCEGYPAPDIARLLDAPLNTVYTWISRGKKALKEALS